MRRTTDAVRTASGPASVGGSVRRSGRASAGRRGVGVAPRPIGAVRGRGRLAARGPRAARPGCARCPRSSRARWPASAARPRGGTWRRRAHRGRRSSGSAGRIVPWACEMRAPGMNAAHREAAERHDDRRIEDLELARQVRRARRDLVGLGIAVVGRTAFDDVRDEHVLAPPADRSEQLARAGRRRGRRTGGPAVLVEAGALADEDDLGEGSPSPGTACVRVSWRRQRVQSRTSAAITSSAARRSASVTPSPADGSGGPVARAPRARLGDPAALDQDLGELDGVRRRALAQVVGHDPEREAAAVRRSRSSWRTRPTKISSRPAASVASG